MVDVVDFGAAHRRISTLTTWRTSRETVCELRRVHGSAGLRISESREFTSGVTDTLAGASTNVMKSVLNQMEAVQRFWSSYFFPVFCRLLVFHKISYPCVCFYATNFPHKHHNPQISELREFCREYQKVGRFCHDLRKIENVAAKL